MPACLPAMRPHTSCLMILALVSSFIKLRKYKHEFHKVVAMIKSVNTHQWQRYLPLPLGTREQGGTLWPLSGSLWNSCVRPLGAFPPTSQQISWFQGRTQVTEFATYFPGDSAASPCVEPLVEQKVLGLWAQTLAHIFTSCVTLSCCLTPSSPQSLCCLIIYKCTLFCEDPTSPVQLMTHNTYSITLSSPGLNLLKVLPLSLGNTPKETKRKKMGLQEWTFGPLCA